MFSGSLCLVFRELKTLIQVIFAICVLVAVNFWFFAVSNLLVLHHTNRLKAYTLSALQSSWLGFSFSSVQSIPSSNLCMIALVLLNLCILLCNGHIFFLRQLQWIILSSILRGHLCSFRTWIIFLQCILTLNFPLRNQLSWDIYLYLGLVPSCSFQYSFFVWYI